MATYSCATNRENIGESKCTKGLLENPNQIMKVDPNFTFTAAEANDVGFWTAAIKNKNAVLFPVMANFEEAHLEATYEETPYAVMKNSQGKYGWRVFYNKNLEVHKNMYTWDGDLDPIILFDDQGKMQTRLIGGEQADPAENTYGGMTPQVFSVENQTINNDATKTPIRILLNDASEWNVDGAIFSQTFTKEIKSLSTVILAEVGTSTSASIVVSVTTENDGGPDRGLVDTDFSGTVGAIATPVVEDPAGTYTLSPDTTFATGNLNLVTPPNSSQFVESSAALTITIT